jgi:hypothetical protein
MLSSLTLQGLIWIKYAGAACGEHASRRLNLIPACPGSHMSMRTGVSRRQLSRFDLSLDAAGATWPWALSAASEVNE